MRYSSRVHKISDDSQSPWSVHHAAMQARARGEDVILLSMGDPEFDTATSIVERTVCALRAGDTHYTELLGRPALRAEIAKAHGALTGQTFDFDDVALACGAQHALFSAFMCLLDPDDEVVALDPVYLTYDATISACGGRMTRAQPSAKCGRRPDISAIARAITPRTRAILLANPGNPTGVVLSREELVAIAELAIRHDLWVVSDEVYASLAFDRPHVAIGGLPGMRNRTVTIGSLSKSHAMTGWRVGWAIACPTLVSHMRHAISCVTHGMPGFVMEGAMAAFVGEASDVSATRDVYRSHRDLVYSRLRDVPGLKCQSPEGGMFMMLDVRGVSPDAATFSRDLFAGEAVSTLDATAFGAAGEGCVRIFYGLQKPKLEEACARIARFVDRRTLRVAAE